MGSKHEDSGKKLFERSREFLETFNKSKHFLEEVLQENERLRLVNAKLQHKLEEKGSAEDKEKISRLEEIIRELKEKVRKLETRYADIEKENKDFAEKFLEVEEQNNNLANLYVASYQLHSTLDFNEVVQIVMEIVINLIGAESFSLYMVDEKNHELTLVASEGMPEDQPQNIALGEGILGKAAIEGESYYIEDFSLRQPGEPLAVIPMSIQDSAIGVLAIFELFQQKEGFTAVDSELFSLLAGHAATALFSARMYTDSERKFSTLKSFLELLKTDSE